MHIFCVSPPLKAVPSGDWFCATCQVGGQKEQPKEGFMSLNKRTMSQLVIDTEAISDDETASSACPAPVAVAPLLVSNALLWTHKYRPLRAKEVLRSEGIIRPHFTLFLFKICGNDVPASFLLHWMSAWREQRRSVSSGDVLNSLELEIHMFIREAPSTNVGFASGAKDTMEPIPGVRYVECA
jgi:hypothetical protein